MKLNPAQQETEEILSELEKRIRTEYRKAEKEVSRKLNEYLQSFAEKDKIKQRQLADGIITKKQYTEWRTGQIMMGRRWQEMRDTLAQDLKNASDIARSVSGKYMAQVYAVNHNYATFEVEKGSLIDTSYSLYNSHAVEKVLQDTKIYPDAGRRTRERIRAGQELAWNKQKIESVMLQGILQGESIPNLSKRLHRVTEGSYKAAIRNARTMTTGIENAGHADAYERAANMGIEVEKVWLATLDDRTRHSHREMDGETIPVDGVFSNGLKYPADPSGDPEEIYNCRCRIIPQVKKYERDLTDLSLRHDAHLGSMSYEEWKKGKGLSEPITEPDDVAELMKWRYSVEYRK